MALALGQIPSTPLGLVLRAHRHRARSEKASSSQVDPFIHPTKMSQGATDAMLLGEVAHLPVSDVHGGGGREWAWRMRVGAAVDCVGR